MREIKFRGMRADGSGWVYGDLCQQNSGNKVIMTNLSTWGDNDDRVDPYGDNILVNPDTIGQFTTVNDVNYKPAYEGDIVRVYHNGNPSCYQIVFKDGCFRLADKDGEIWFSIDVFPFEVIGNIFDNKSLLEK